MAGIKTNTISSADAPKLLSLQEGHFSDFKASDILPGKLTRTIAAFANAEGGELYIGVDEQKATGKRCWNGFSNIEAANGHIQAFESLFPLGADFSYEFLTAD